MVNKRIAVTQATSIVGTTELIAIPKIMNIIAAIMRFMFCLPIAVAKSFLLFN